MTDRYWLVAMIPDEWRAAGNAISAAMGWGAVAYSVPWPEAGAPTGWLMSVEVSAEFVSWLEGEPIALPAGVNLDLDQVRAVIAKIKWVAEDASKRPNPAAMRERLLAEHG